MATRTDIFVQKLFSIFLLTLQVVYVSAQSSSSDWLEKGNQLYVQEKYDEAIIWYQKAAEQGNAEAQFYLGYALYQGEGIRRNYPEATRWFKQAARQGYPKAKYNLACCYMNGQGVPRDPDKAIQLLKEAGYAGCQEAQLKLAECYDKGVVEPKDAAQSQMWKRLAAGLPVESMPPSPSDPETDSLSPPTVNILYPEDSSYFHTRTIQLKYQLVAPGMEQQTQINIWVDGEKPKQDRIVCAPNTVDVDVPPHDCEIKLRVQNANGYSEDSIRLRYEQTGDERPRLFVVAIGVGDYSDPNLLQLKYASRDAEEFSSILKDKRDSPYSEIQVKLCKDSVSRMDFFEAIKWMADESRDTDLCIFYYAGHGYLNERNNYYFMPSDAYHEQSYTAISANEFYDAIEKVHSKVTMLFIDACYSGTLTQGFPETNMILYASSGADTKSKEDEQWKNGAFTKALIEAFESDNNKEDKFNLNPKQLYDYLHERVRTYTENRQTPVYHNPRTIDMKILDNLQ